MKYVVVLLFLVVVGSLFLNPYTTYEEQQAFLFQAITERNPEICRNIEVGSLLAPGHTEQEREEYCIRQTAAALREKSYCAELRSAERCFEGVERVKYHFDKCESVQSDYGRGVCFADAFRMQLDVFEEFNPACQIVGNGKVLSGCLSDFRWR